MNVETNGTVDAEDAIAYSARIQDQLALFVNFEDLRKPEVKSSEPEFNRNLLKELELELSEIMMS